VSFFGKEVELITRSPIPLILEPEVEVLNKTKELLHTG
jgi:hypothetical protein